MTSEDSSGVLTLAKLEEAFAFMTSDDRNKEAFDNAMRRVGSMEFINQAIDQQIISYNEAFILATRIGLDGRIWVTSSMAKRLEAVKEDL